jgi:hypothetical protein
VLTDLRHRLADLAAVVAALDARLAAADALEVPSMQVARLAVDLDLAAARLQRHAEALDALGQENFPP